MPNSRRQLELQISADPAQDPATLSFSAGSAQLRQFLENAPVDERARYAADLAYEELGTNILSYGFAQGQNARFQLQVHLSEGLLHLVFEDNGAAFDPTASTAPAPAASLSEARIGGLGLPMVRRLVQQMHYQRRGATNRLEIQIQCG